jgi:hypothetical protein
LPSNSHANLPAHPIAGAQVIAEADQVKAQLPALAEIYGVDETVVLTICHDFAARKAAARCSPTPAVSKNQIDLHGTDRSIATPHADRAHKAFGLRYAGSIAAYRGEKYGEQRRSAQARGDTCGRCRRL